MIKVLEKVIITSIVIFFSSCGITSLVIDLKKDNSLTIISDIIYDNSEKNRTEKLVNDLINYIDSIATLLNVNMQRQELYIIDDDTKTRVRLSFKSLAQVNEFQKEFKKSARDFGKSIIRNFDLILNPVQKFSSETIWSVNFSTSSSFVVGYEKDNEAFIVTFNMPGKLKSWTQNKDNPDYKVVQDDQNTVVYTVYRDFADSGRPSIDILVESYDLTIDTPSPINNIEVQKTEVTEIDNSVDNSKKNETKNFYIKPAILPKDTLSSPSSSSNKNGIMAFPLLREIILLCTAILGFLTAWLVFITKRRKKDDE